MKKITALFIMTAVLIAACKQEILPLPDLEESPESDFEYVRMFGPNEEVEGELLELNEIMITRYIGTSKQIRIPEEIDGLPVTFVSGGMGTPAPQTTGMIPVFDDVEYVILPSSLWLLGDFVFLNCEKMTSIIIPDSVEVLGWGTFYGCKGLSSISLPDGMTRINATAFAYCTGLTEILIPDSVYFINESAFEGCKNLTNVTYKGITYNGATQDFFEVVNAEYFNNNQKRG